MKKIAVENVLFAAVLSLGASLSRASAQQEYKWHFAHPQTKPGTANEFIFNSGDLERPSGVHLRVSQFKLQARLLTPLNSSFNKYGDVVLAEVFVPPAGLAGRLFPRGTILEGVVSRSRPARLFQTQGKLIVNFYRTYIGDRILNLDVVATNDESLISRLEPPTLTRKQSIREGLITATRLAVPAAIGSGGLSLAITTGTGAAIGCILADDKKYARGAIHGAWEGSGLCALDPIVGKGQEAIVPTGTFIELSLSDPVDLTIPADVLERINAPPKQQLDASAKILYKVASQQLVPVQESLTTTAELRKSGTHGDACSYAYEQNSYYPNDSATTRSLEKVNLLLRQQNLAGAVAVVEKEYAAHPQNQEVQQMRNRLINLVGGSSE